MLQHWGNSKEYKEGVDWLPVAELKSAKKVSSLRIYILSSRRSRRGAP